MPHIVLVNPEIPPNTGNIIRLAANCGAPLHLVKPLGFTLQDKHLRRAGLDYHEYAEVKQHDTLQAAIDAINAAGGQRRFIVTADGGMRYDKVRYQREDVFIFGCESCGLPPAVRRQYPASAQLYLPMRPHSRSFNLSNAAAILLMEAWRQLAFEGAARR